MSKRTEYIAYCVTCANDSGWLATDGDASEWLDENHPVEMGCTDTGIAEEGDVIVLSGDVCGEFEVGDWLGSSTDETVVHVDHFEFYAGFGFIACDVNGEKSVYLDTSAKVEPADEDEDIS